MGRQARDDNRSGAVGDKFEVRMMEKVDIEQVCFIEKKSFSMPWSAFAFESELLDNQLAYYCVVCFAEQPEKIVGHGGLWIILDEAHITNIAIDPRHRGQHLGEMLVRRLKALAFLKGAQKMTLEVRVSNNSALKLYRRLDFHEEGVRKRYYTDNGEDALIMWCNLTEKDLEVEV